MARASFPLDHTLAETWRAGLAGNQGGEKSHWRTKTAYYQGIGGLLEAVPAPRLSWEAVTSAVPGGNRTTFYDVTGPHAAHPLLREYRASSDPDLMQLVLTYTRTSATDQLIDEAKVYYYWPYREGWLSSYRGRLDLSALVLTSSLLWVLVDWARRHPGLAHALDCAPPVCAVEDLLVIRRGELAAARAFKILTDTVRRAAGAPAERVAEVVTAARTELGLTRHGAASPDALLAGLAEHIFAMKREFRRLPPDDAGAAWRRAAHLMSDATRGSARVAEPSRGDDSALALRGSARVAEPSRKDDSALAFRGSARVAEPSRGDDSMRDDPVRDDSAGVT